MQELSEKKDFRFFFFFFFDVAKEVVVAVIGNVSEKGGEKNLERKMSVVKLERGTFSKSQVALASCYQY